MVEGVELSGRPRPRPLGGGAARVARWASRIDSPGDRSVTIGLDDQCPPLLYGLAAFLSSRRWSLNAAAPPTNREVGRQANARDAPDHDHGWGASAAREASLREARIVPERLTAGPDGVEGGQRGRRVHGADGRQLRTTPL